MTSVYEGDGTETFLFVHVATIFNQLNRQVANHSYQFMCPALALILINTYSDPSLQLVDKKHLQSNEGTSQENPLATAMYGMLLELSPC